MAKEQEGKKPEGRLIYVVYNEVTQDYSYAVGPRPYRMGRDHLYIKLDDLIAQLNYMINTNLLEAKRKMTLITNVPEQDFKKLKESLEKKLFKTNFINKKF